MIKIHQISLSTFICLLTIFSSQTLGLSTPSSREFVFNQAQALSSDDSQVAGEKLLNVGLRQYQRDEFRDAIESWQQALTIFKQLNHTHYEGAVLSNLGIAHRALGEYSQAIDYLNQALIIKQQQGDFASPVTVLILSNLASTYGEIGNYNQAITYHENSLTIAKEIGDIRRQAMVLGNLGANYASLGDFSLAIDYYTQSLTIAKELGYREGEGHVLSNLGFAHHSLNKLDEAINYYKQSLTIAEEINNSFLKASVLNKLGIAYKSLGNYPQAIEYYYRALTIAQATGAKTTQASVLNNLAHTLFTSGNLKESEAKLRQAIDLLDSLRQELNHSYHVSLFDTQAMTYNLLQQVLIAQERPEAALEMSEHGRARAIVSLLSQRLGSASANLANPPSLEQIKHIARTRKATLVEYAIIPEDMLHQGKLKGEGAEIYIWVVSPTGKVNFRRVDISNLGISLGELVKTSRNSLGVRGIANRSLSVQYDPDASKFEEYLAQLHQLLIEPIGEFLPEDPEEPVIFVPHNEIFLAPFPALRDAQGTYLVEKHTILTAPSIQVLDITHQINQETVGTGKEKPLVVGNPTMPSIRLKGEELPLPNLPGAQLEAETVAQMLDTQALIGDQATETTVVQRMPTAGIIHLATHGLLDNFGGEIPGVIALAPDTPSAHPTPGETNGLLTSSEIFNLDLSAQLVVLSACDTGRGDLTADGVIGLSRSFIAAGVPSVVVSLWQVPDQPTADLMAEFYRNLQQNPDKAQALRKAMLATLKNILYQETGLLLP